MGLEQTNSAKRPTDVLSLCRAIAERSPVPTAEIDVVTKTILYVNFAFCLLTGKTKEELTGSRLTSTAPKGIDWLKLLDDVVQSGEMATCTETHYSVELR